MTSLTPAKGHVLITGAAVRVGRVIALTLAQNGWDITVHYNKSQSDAESLADEIARLSRRATIVQANFENKNEIEWLIPPDPAYPLTALINNASLFEHDTQDPDGERHNKVNNEAPRLLTERLMAQLPPDLRGAVVHIMDNTPIPQIMSAYAASRERLRRDIAAQAKIYATKLRINGIALGPTMPNARQSQEHFDRLIASTPLSKPSTPQAVAQAILFLLENPAITGQILQCDSGLHLFTPPSA
ncbi:MAG: SDR family NAD(P)-dependent oxidoreductase [Bdellovibrionales bacterium]